MERLNKFYQGTQQGCEATYPSQYFDASIGVGDIEPEQYFPLDAFDKQILAQYSDGYCCSNAENSLQYPFSAPNINTQRTYEGTIGVGLGAIADLSDGHSYPQRSSSPAFPLSSPTVSALQQRYRTKDHFGRVPQLPKALGSSHPPPTIQGIDLVPIDRLPDHLRSIFSFPIFNAVQSRCFSTAFETDDNLVVSAPTGSGKTVIMELTLCRLLLTNKAQDFKVIYQAPTKSLCSERYRDWTKKFSSLGLRCAELTGDIEHTQLRTVQTAHIIVTTPEKWDSTTRKWRDDAKLMGMIKLFLIDEVHILNESRGATLEAVVSRMKSTDSHVRFVALSATVPNSEDIATWLGRNSSTPHLSAHREVFDESFRPVKLEKHVLGYNCRPNDFALDSLLTKEIPTIIARYAKRKPSMIFCVSRNSATKTATSLAEAWFSAAAPLRSWNPPPKQIKVVNQDLQKIVPAGVAFHHSGLDVADRDAVEQGFLHGLISIICSTSTLAVGVNLPCYLVVLKGTSCWSDNGLQEYSSLEVKQMLGRAGRPQFETSACAVVMTYTAKTPRYEGMISGQEVLESSLHKNLIEHLNAEIGTGVIFDVESAKRWMSSTFLSVRLRINPAHYRLEEHAAVSDPDQLLEIICERDLRLLGDAQLVSSGSRMQCTEYGKAMARYYVQYETMLVFAKLAEKAKLPEIINVLAQAHEFRDLKLRSGEKAMYKKINKANDIRYPINVDVALPVHKTSLIIQAHLGGVVLDKSYAKYSTQFKQDTFAVVNHCNRLIRCIIDMQIYQQDAVTVKNALELCRSMAAGVWDNTPMQLKQIESIGDVTARRLAAAGISTIDALLGTEPQRIEVVLGKVQPFGNNLLKKTSRFPNLHISVREIDKVRKDSSGRITVRLKCDIGHFNEPLPLFFNHKAVYICFLCQTSYGKLVEFRRFGARHLTYGEQIFLTIVLDEPCSFIKCHVMCDEIAGTHRFAELKVDIPNTWFVSVASHTITSKTANGISPSPSEQTSGFDDDGLGDDDFLAVESNIGNVGVTDNGDEHTLVIENQNKKSLKRKTPARSDGVNSTALLKRVRQSTQLANGNWTCQHTCNEEGKECKHQCCKDGVKKPKRKGKIQTIRSEPGMKMESHSTTADLHGRNLDRDQVHDIDDIDEILGRITKYRKVSAKNSERSAESFELSEKNLVGLSNKLPSVPYVQTNSFELESDGFPPVDELLKDSNSQDVAWRTDQDSHKSSKTHEAIYDVDNVSAEDTWDIPLLSNSDLNEAGVFGQNMDRTTQEPSGCTENTEPVTTVSFIVNSAKDLSATSNQFPDEPAYHAVEDISDDFSDIDNDDLAALEGKTPPRPEVIAGNLVVAQTTSMYDNTIDAAPRPLSDTGTVKDTVSRQMEKDRRQELREETQREKWARLPAWMYETYGAYVNII